MKHHPTRTDHLLTAGLLTLVMAAACGDLGDGDASEEKVGDGVENPSGDGDAAGAGPGGAHPGIMQGDGGEDSAEPDGLPAIDESAPLALPPLAVPPPCGLADAPFLFGGNVEASGYLHVQDDISSAGAITQDAVTPLGGATSHSVFPDGTAYVSYWEKPIIEKWEVGALDIIERTGVLELASAGVSSTGSTRDLVQILSPTKGYYIDPENNYVLGFNPKTMKLDGVFIDLTEGFGPADEFMALGDVHRDGDHLIVSARFWDDDWNVESVVRAAFIDATDDSVTFAEDTRCGDVAWHATDSAGNLYLGSHYDNVGAKHVEDFGLTGTDSCIIRIKRGERSFDESYYVDMDDLLGGIGTTLLQGPGDQAYVMKYAGAPMTRDNWQAVLSGARWELFAITLGDEANSLTQVDLDGKRFNPTPTPFCSDNTQSIIGFSGNDFESGQLFIIDSADDSTAALSYFGALGRGVSLN